MHLLVVPIIHVPSPLYNLQTAQQTIIFVLFVGALIPLRVRGYRHAMTYAILIRH